MARAQEKKTTLFSKWAALKEEEQQGRGRGGGGGGGGGRDEILSVADAERVRRGVVRELSTQITRIEEEDADALGGEHLIRDLNDQINRLLRRKHYLEKRIKDEFGGANYFVASARTLEAKGAVLPGMPGYRYFGAAKELPGVRELFEQEEREQREQREARKKRRTKRELEQTVRAVEARAQAEPDAEDTGATHGYYGKRAEDEESHPRDRIVLDEEMQREAEWIRESVEAMEQKKRQDAEQRRLDGLPPLDDADSDAEDEEAELQADRNEAQILHGAQDLMGVDVAQALLEHKRQRLLAALLAQAPASADKERDGKGKG